MPTPSEVEKLNKEAEENQKRISEIERLPNFQQTHSSEIESLYAKQRNLNARRFAPQAQEALTQEKTRERIGMGIEKSMELAERYIPEGSLGRVEGPSAELQQFRDRVLQERKSAFETAQAREAEGLTQFETSLLQSRGTQTIQRSEETMRRRLQALQNRLGVRGGTATAQQLGVLQQGAVQRAQLEQNIAFQDIQRRREQEGEIRAERARTLSDFETAVESRILDERALQKQNLSLAAAERSARFSFAFGLQGMSEQAISTEKSIELAKQALSARSGAGGGKK